jgi:hypothetical protein
MRDGRTANADFTFTKYAEISQLQASINFYIDAETAPGLDIDTCVLCNYVH